MIQLCVKPGGSDDKLLIESLPGGRKENTIIQDQTMCSWALLPGGCVAQGGWDAGRGRAAAGGRSGAAVSPW